MNYNFDHLNTPHNPNTVNYAIFSIKTYCYFECVSHTGHNYRTVFDSSAVRQHTSNYIRLNGLIILVRSRRNNLQRLTLDPTRNSIHHRKPTAYTTLRGLMSQGPK